MRYDPREEAIQKRAREEVGLKGDPDEP